MSSGDPRGEETRNSGLRNWKDRIATSCIEENCQSGGFKVEKSEFSCGQVRFEMPVGYPDGTVD